MQVFITVRGFGWGVTPIVKKAAFFYARRLLGKTRAPIFIDIKAMGKPDDDIYGYCSWDDTNHNPRQFVIELANVGVELIVILQNLAHEMVHVKQYVKRELKDLKSGVSLWKKVYWEVKQTDLPYEWYVNLPWEAEAYQKEGKLLESFLDAVDNETTSRII